MTQEQLREYRDLRKERDKLKNTILKIDSLLYGIRGPRLDGMPRSGAGEDTGRREAQIDRRRRLHKLYLEKVAAIESQMMAIEAAINNLPSRLRTVCRLYYIEGMTWEQVTAEVSYSWSQVHRYHARALQMLEEEDNDIPKREKH